MKLKRLIFISFLFFCILIPTTASAIIPGTEGGLDFKEILWDAGWMWILMLVMGLAWIFDAIRQIIRDSKGGKGEVEEGPKAKPSYEILIRRKIE
jgi:hypothetical protein